MVHLLPLSTAKAGWLMFSVSVYACMRGAELDCRYYLDKRCKLFYYMNLCDLDLGPLEKSFQFFLTSRLRIRHSTHPKSTEKVATTNWFSTNRVLSQYYYYTSSADIFPIAIGSSILYILFCWHTVEWPYHLGKLRIYIFSQASLFLFTSARHHWSRARLNSSYYHRWNLRSW